MTILATAYADPAQKGTGENEPALFTVRYGKGRVFHTVLGHAPEQMRSVGFIVTLPAGRRVGRHRAGHPGGGPGGHVHRRQSQPPLIAFTGGTRP